VTQTNNFSTMNYTYCKELTWIENLDFQYNSLYDTAIILLQDLHKANEEQKIFVLEETNNLYTIKLWGLKFEIWPEIPIGQDTTRFISAEMNTYLINDDKTKELVYTCPFNSHGLIHETHSGSQFGYFYIKDFIETLFKYFRENDIKFRLCSTL
jgi:hypothetical protein